MTKNKEEQGTTTQELKNRVKELEGNLQTSEKYASEREADYRELVKAFDEMQAKFKGAKEKYEDEKCLKNEAYAFILSSGALDKFLEFQNEYFKRSPQDNAISYLVANAQPDGEWISQ